MLKDMLLTITALLFTTTLASPAGERRQQETACDKLFHANPAFAVTTWRCTGASTQTIPIPNQCIAGYTLEQCQSTGKMVTFRDDYNPPLCVFKVYSSLPKGSCGEPQATPRPQSDPKDCYKLYRPANKPKVCQIKKGYVVTGYSTCSMSAELSSGDCRVTIDGSSCANQCKQTQGCVDTYFEKFSGTSQGRCWLYSDCCPATPQCTGLLCR